MLRGCSHAILPSLIFRTLFNMQHVSEHLYTARRDDLPILSHDHYDGHPVSAYDIDGNNVTLDDIPYTLPSEGYDIFNERPSPSVSSNQVCLPLLVVDSLPIFPCVLMVTSSIHRFPNPPWTKAQPQTYVLSLSQPSAMWPRTGVASCWSLPLLVLQRRI